MSSRRDAYATRFLNEARTMLLSQLDTAGHGTLRRTAIAREDDRDVFSAEFTLIGRPGIVFVLRRTAYSPSSMRRCRPTPQCRRCSATSSN